MSSVVIAGDSSGTVTLQAPAVAGSTVITLPTVSGGSFVVSNSSGNVGIGTASPAVKLDVNGALSVASGYNITWGGAYGANIPTMYGVSGASAYIAWNVKGSSGESMRIDSSGNVGIGTSSPSASYRLSLTGGAGLNIANTGASDNAIVKYSNSGKNWYAGLRGDTSNVWALADDSAFRLTVDTSGNFMVGKTTTSFTTAGWSLGTPYGNSSYGFDMGGATNECFNYNNIGTGTYDVAFRYQGIAKGYIRTSSTTVAYTNLSDYRLKEDIQPMEGALSKVLLLKPCTYKWKVDGAHGQGFIAHELQAVVPDAVTGQKDEINEDGSIKPQGIDTGFLVATLTAAIQELKAELDAAKADIATLKGAA